MTTGSPRSCVLELLTIGAALVALQRFRAPLLVLPIAVTFAIALIDLGAEEYMAIVAGLILVAVGHAVDRAGRQPYAMWLHLVGGASFGGGVLALVDGDAGWILVGLLSVAYVAGAHAFGRSSYAVLGAIGILATTTYFIEDGLSFVGALPSRSTSAIPRVASTRGRSRFYYVFAGLLILALGLVGDRFARSHGDAEA